MTTPLRVVPSRRCVCLDCAAALMASGGVRVAGEIAYGTACEVHPSALAPGATHLVEGGAPPARETLPAVESVDLPPMQVLTAGAPALALGPLTELSARLLVAWTSGDDDGGTMFELVIPRAVRAARALLRETEGK